VCVSVCVFVCVSMCVCVLKIKNVFAFISQACVLISIVQRHRIIRLFPENLFRDLHFQTARNAFSVCLEIILYIYYVHAY
jgi:hypothetical protein